MDDINQDNDDYINTLNRTTYRSEQWHNERIILKGYASDTIIMITFLRVKYKDNHIYKAWSENDTSLHVSSILSMEDFDAVCAMAFTKYLIEAHKLIQQEIEEKTGNNVETLSQQIPINAYVYNL
jgi:hypothetical protein